MTDIKLLTLLNSYYNVQRNVVTYMIWAMEDLERGREDASWVQLFYWCQAKDEREELWKQFKSDYPRAMRLKEGFCDD